MKLIEIIKVEQQPNTVGLKSSDIDSNSKKEVTTIDGKIVYNFKLSDDNLLYCVPPDATCYYIDPKIVMKRYGYINIEEVATVGTEKLLELLKCN